MTILHSSLTKDRWLAELRATHRIQKTALEVGQAACCSAKGISAYNIISYPISQARATVNGALDQSTAFAAGRCAKERWYECNMSTSTSNASPAKESQLTQHVLSQVSGVTLESQLPVFVNR
ncbi:unnamed protein product [Leuciscus chuanchicus]